MFLAYWEFPSGMDVKWFQMTLASIKVIVWFLFFFIYFLSFGLFMWWIIFIDSLILNPSYIPGKDPTWPWGFSFNKLLGFDCQYFIIFYMYIHKGDYSVIVTLCSWSDFIFKDMPSFKKTIWEDFYRSFHLFCFCFFHGAICRTQIPSFNVWWGGTSNNI